MQPALGRKKEAAELSKSRSPLIGEVETLLKEAHEGLKIEARGAVFDQGKKLTGDDLKIFSEPEEFTRQSIINKVLALLGVHSPLGRNFQTPDNTSRKVDYGIEERRFLAEAKPINSDLYEKTKDGAVNQIKGIFTLAEAKDNYDFGIATDGLKWIFIGKDGAVIAECDLVRDFSTIEAYITGRKSPKTLKREAEISKRFYEWYNALLHGGLYRDLKGKKVRVREEDCLVKNISTVQSEEEREEIAQVIVDRLIFIKFLQAKGLVKEDLLAYLATLQEDVLNWKLKQLFFNILNTEEGKRSDVDPTFREVPYLNGSLFVKIRTEEKNSEYQVKAEILKKVIEFLNAFRFVSEGEETEEALNPEILGYLFERAITATDRKGTGAYYTPKTITRYICENTVYPYMLDQVNRYLKEKKGYKDSELLNAIDEMFTRIADTTLADINTEILPEITVCDPACGSGAFLLAAADILLDIHQRVRDKLGARSTDVALKKLVLKNSIYGVDINHKAIEIAKLRLWLWIVESYSPGKKPEPLPNLEYNIRPGNSLVGYIDILRFREAKVSMDEYLGVETPVMDLIKERDDLLKEYKSAYGSKAQELKKRLRDFDEKIKLKLDIHLFLEMQEKKIPISPTEFAKLDPFHWGFDFHKVFENGGGGFSVVIGNPPYFSIATLPKEHVNYFSNYFKEVFAGNSDILYYFFARSRQLTVNRGYIGYITARYFQEAKYAKKLRKYLSSNSWLTNLVDFMNFQVFGNEVNVLTSISVLKSQPPAEKSVTVVSRIRDDTKSPEEVSEALFDPTSPLFERFESASPHLSEDDWAFLPLPLKKLEEKFLKYSFQLGEIATIVQSMQTGKNPVLAPPVETIEKFKIEKELVHPVAKSGSIVRYCIEEEDRKIIWTEGIKLSDYPILEAYLRPYKDELSERYDIRARKANWWEISNPRNADLFFGDHQRILVPFMATGNKFCVDTEKRLNDGGDLRAIFFNKGNKISPYYVCAILNSKAAEKYHKTHSKLKRGGYYEYYEEKLSQFPIHRISFSTSKPERQRLVDEMKTLYSKGDLNQVLRLAQGCLPRDGQGNPALDKEKSDVVHDLLAFMAERMIKMSKEKQGAVKAFLERLEGILGVKIEDLTGKAALREYHDRDWNEIKKVLDKNRAKVRKIEEAGTLEAIKREFEDSKERLSPLVNKIKETDDLIDQVVYRLYGLTEDEITVVSGK